MPGGGGGAVGGRGEYSPRGLKIWFQVSLLPFTCQTFRTSYSAFLPSGLSSTKWVRSALPGLPQGVVTRFKLTSKLQNEGTHSRHPRGSALLSLGKASQVVRLREGCSSYQQGTGR